MLRIITMSVIMDITKVDKRNSTELIISLNLLRIVEKIEKIQNTQNIQIILMKKILMKNLVKL